jgi:signal transduction histidine kinase
MASPDRRSWVLPGAVLVLAALLGLLATLQYRWVGEITASERARLQAGARNRAEQLGRDFDREITQAYAALQVDEASAESGDWHAYAERYARWASRAPHPDLVRDVYLVRETGRKPASATLARFDESRGSFVETSWPPEMESLKARLDAPPSDAGPPRILAERDLEVGDAPALVAPVIPSMPAPSERGRPRESLRRRGVVVMVLDPATIREEILPALARRYFTGSEGALEYAVQVTDGRSPATVVYDSAGAGRPARIDAAATLFALRFDALTDRDRSNLAPALRRFAGRGERRGRGAFRAFAPPPDAGRWRLAVSRIGGSVDDVVEAARRRNLAVSFGILLLLGGSAVLVLAAASRARRLAARQMEFVAGVSHELRTPLAVVCSAAENLADGVVSEAPQVRRYGATIRDEGRRLAEMVEQVLDFAGTYSGRRALRVAPVDPAVLVEEVLATEGRRAESEGFAVEKRVEPGLPAMAGDAAALRRALRNLVDNARKYGGPGRWIGVSVSPASLGVRRAVRFSVEDRGAGVEAQERKRIFEPFYRGRASHGGAEHGFGLGLSLVQRIVSAHGGAVEVAARPEGGSAFSMIVPAVAAQAVPASTSTQRSVHGIADSAR